MSQDYFPPAESEGGWRTSDPAEPICAHTKMDRRVLDDAFDFIQTSSKNGGLLALRHGWLVYERYFGRGHREATPNLASCGKSFTSIAIGMLMAERPDLFPDGLDQKIFTPTYFPAHAFPLTDPAKAEISLGQLLAFTAGIRGNNPVYVDGNAGAVEPVGPDGWQAMVDEIALGLEDGLTPGGQPFTTATLWCEPGSGYSYATASIHLASLLLRHVTGVEMSDFLAERLAAPLGWGRWGFGYRHTRAGAHMSGGGGIALASRDMLRFGYLMLREGRWRDRQLIPAAYVRHCARRSPYNPHFPYSLQFDVNSDGAVPDLPGDAFWKSGSGGHALYVVPSLDLVVWKLGGRDEQYDPANTGLPAAPESSPIEDDWQPAVVAEEALHQTLRKVIAAVREAQ